ncbi:MAG: hypothetical protein R2830_27465, partial [Saprospiraceae bacterium]
ISVPQTYRPVIEECNEVQPYFQPCTCDGSEVNTEEATTTEPSNPFVAVGKMDLNVLDVTGPEAVVDWVVVELRDEDNDKVVVKAITALETRDGEVVSEEGDSILYFPGLPEGNYYVTIRHRNHLGMMTDVPFYLSTENVPLIDFTDVSLPVRGGTGAGRMNNGERTMWAGDFNEDGKVIFQGPFNDVFTLFSRVLSDESNGDILANYIVTGYELQDYNLDGKVIYQGPFNDKAPMLYNSILSHPANNALLANYIVKGTLP